MSETSRPEKIRQLMALQFPGLSTPVEIANRERMPRGFSDKRAANAKAYLLKLTQMTDAELEPIFIHETEKAAAQYRAKWEEEERQRFFNAPGSSAVFQHWAKAAYWSLDEAVALSFRKEPNIVTWAKIKPILQFSSFAVQFNALRDLAIRAKATGQLFDPVLPGLFISWAKRMKIEFPEELEKLVEEFGGFVGDWKTLYDQLNEANSKTIAGLNAAIEGQAERFKSRLESTESSAKALAERQRDVIMKLEAALHEEKAKRSAKPDQQLGERERDSLLKIVIGMAMEKFGYAPSAAKSPTTARIATVLTMRGIPLDEDTIRKYLQEARRLLPDA